MVEALRRREDVAAEDELACLRILWTIDPRTRATCRRPPSIITGTFAASDEAAPAFRRWYKAIRPAAHLGLACPVRRRRQAARRARHHASNRCCPSPTQCEPGAGPRTDGAPLLGGDRKTSCHETASGCLGLSTKTATCRTVAAIVAWRYGASESRYPGSSHQAADRAGGW